MPLVNCDKGHYQPENVPVYISIGYFAFYLSLLVALQDVLPDQISGDILLQYGQN